MGQFFATDINGVFLGYDINHVYFKTPAEHTIDGNSYDLEI